MNWTKFDTHGESSNHAFEVMCNLIFEDWCKEKYGDDLVQFSFVNGSGGDGGVEAYGVLKNGDVIAVQSKWFPNKIEDSQINQIKNSLKTALEIRPNIKQYIVCVPRDFGSKKKVSEGVSKNNEESRWDSFIKRSRKDYPTVRIIPWDETTIQKKLTKPSLQGINKYWFDNTIIFDKQFRVSYEKVISSWGKTKYIPEIYTKGFIHKNLECFLGSSELSEQHYNQLRNFIERIELLIDSYNDLLEVIASKEIDELEIKIKNDVYELKKIKEELKDNKDIVRYGGDLKNISKSLTLDCTVKDLKEHSLYFEKSEYFKEVEKRLSNIHDDYYYLIQDVCKDTDNKMIFLGEAGTGKTAGIVAEADKLLDNSDHLPVIVHAKEFSNGDTWLSIITKSLGLNSSWEETELYGALQCAALLNGNKNNGKKFSTEHNCVILVDGIDESKDWNFWVQKINEVDAIKDSFPRIKFVFLSRPYVFDYNQELFDSPYTQSIPDTGDADLEVLCERYFSEYHIDIGENLWIKQSLNTPLAIRLFCEKYRNQMIENLEKNTVILTEIFKKKMKSLQDTYYANHPSIRDLTFVGNAIIDIAELFGENDFIEYEDISKIDSAQLQKNLDSILDFLVGEGVIYRVIESKDEFSTKKTLYSWGMQPFFDYLIAVKKNACLERGQQIVVKEVNGVSQMLSLILIEKKGLISNIDNVKIQIADGLELNLYALSNCSLDIAKKYKGYLKDLMQSSVAMFRKVFSKVIFNVLRIDNHPLGSILLDEYLREFAKPVERDIYWSMPTINKNIDEKYISHDELELDQIILHYTDKYMGAPLALVWTLSTLNTETRRDNRVKLMAWGVKQPIEYWKLFEYCVSINDLQILEDIFAVAYGIALGQSFCREYVSKAADWMMNHVFSVEGLKKYENIVLRYYASGIVKIAISQHLVDTEALESITPPFKYDSECLPLYRPAVETNRQYGYEAISYDLAEYVLCDKLDCYFRKDSKTRKYKIDAEDFLSKYKDRYKLNKLNIDGLIISLVYQFLLDEGYDDNLFWFDENKKIYGIDVYIRSEFRCGSYGDMSSIMTVSEKYVWLAKHKLEAIFSNEISLYDEFGKRQYTNNSPNLDYFVNTYQDYINDLNKSNKCNWFNKNLIASLNSKVIDKESIEKWIKNKNVPEFKKWIFDDSGNIILYAFSDVVNDNCGIREAICINTGVINKDDSSILCSIKTSDFEDVTVLTRVSDFYAWQNCHYYCTPQEVCLVHQDLEVERNTTIHTNDKDVNLFKLVSKCIASDGLDEMPTFVMPSYLTRKISKIVYGDGYSYFDENGNEKANYSFVGERLGTYQEILSINKNTLTEGLNDSNLQMVWLFRIYRVPSFKARERYEDIASASDVTYLVWFDDDGKIHRRKLVG